jgi:uncharacterized membrane protein YdbT with pleckstrin-like domain
MSYAERVLQPGERMLHQSKLHWLVYMAVVPFVAIAIAGAALYAALNDPTSVAPPALVTIGVVGAVLAWLRGWIRRASTELAVTDRRVIFKRGVIRRHTIEMNMDKVESVDVDQSILGRIFNYGDVTIRGTGASLEPLRMIEDPLKFRSYVTAR